MMHGSTFISDNEYFCTGASIYNVQRIYKIKTSRDFQFIIDLPQSGVFILSVENLGLRSSILKKIVKYAKFVIVFDLDILPGALLKMDNVLYTSCCLTAEMLTGIMNSYWHFKNMHISSREMEVLKMSYLSNKDLAEKLCISVKTCSAHRINIQNKFHLKFRNNIAMERIRQKTAIHINAFCSTHNWEEFGHE